MATERSITPTHPVLVVGGTGKTGRRVAERLRAPSERGAHRPRATPPFDWNDPATWQAAFRGVRAAYIT